MDNNEKISFTIFLAVSFVLCYAQPAIALQQEKGVMELANLPPSSEKEWSEEESEEIAERLLRNSPTFISRGIGDSLTLLNTTLMDEAFSWQFDYEFKCSYSGYGWLGSEPTPQAVTPHLARIVVREGEVIYAVLDDEWDILAAMSAGYTYSPPTDMPEGNLVRVHFMEECAYRASGDSFIKKEVTVEEWWRTNLVNEMDKTGATVTELRLTLASESPFEGVFGGIERELLTKMGPPIYEWILGDIPNAETVATNGWPWDAFVSRHNSPTKVEPGYDVSRSFDKTEFSMPDIQTVTITVTPREKSIDKIDIFVHTEENDLVNPVVTSYSSISGGEVNIAQEGHRSGIHFVPVELDTPLIVTVTIQVNPKVPLVHYRAGFTIHPHLSMPSSGTTIGSSVSFTNEMGTWTWSAEGNYVWHWFGPDIHDIPGVSVSLNESSALPASPTSEDSSTLIPIFIFSGIAVIVILTGLIIYTRVRNRTIAR
jgi:hypothetical protein